MSRNRYDPLIVELILNRRAKSCVPSSSSYILCLVILALEYVILALEYVILALEDLRHRVVPLGKN
jgi:hypothetical protein